VPSPDVSPAAGPAVAAPDGVELQDMLETWIDDVHAFGAVVGVRVPGQRDVVVAGGVDGRNPETPMRTDGRFQIASITKTFVTVIVLSLVDAGTLRLEDTIDRWFPQIADADRITVTMLLSHRSGLADFAADRPDEFRAIMLADLEHRYTPSESIALSSALPARFPPGAAYSYSNTNFQILGEIAAAVTGTPVDDLIAGLVEPLGLDETSMNDQASVEPDEHHGWFTLDPAIGDLEADTFDPTVARDLDILEFPRTAVVTQIGAAGAMRSTIHDLLDWGEQLYTRDVLSPATRRLMIASTTSPGEVDDDDSRIEYGLGTMLIDSTGPADLRLVGHDGSIIGGRTLLAVNPDTGVVIVIHANVQEITLHDLAGLARDLLHAIVTGMTTAGHAGSCDLTQSWD
jgi:D-alanyl-D-alanine carboxypeptidase